MLDSSRSWKSRLAILLLGFNLLQAVLATAIVHRKGGFPWIFDKAAGLLTSQQAEKRGSIYYEGRVSVFDEIPIHSENLVFLGDSIFEFGEWHELLGDPNAVNRAIKGDDTTTVLRRIDQIVEGAPEKVVLCLGVNNLQKRMGLERTKREYQEIVDKLLAGSERTEVWLVQAFPANPWLYKQHIVPSHGGIHMPTVDEVADLNRFLQQTASSHPRVHHVPVPEVLDSSGRLTEEYTIDGLHLNGAGLKAVAHQVRKALAETETTPVARTPDIPHGLTKAPYRG